MSVAFSVESRIAASWDEPRISRLVESIVARELPEVSDWTASLHFVSDPTIAGLNREHRGQDTVTDVLSFPLHSTEFVLPPGEPLHLGDVVISYPRAVAQAEAYGHAVEREIAYLVAHGVLHILGYNHEEEAEREQMRRKEEEALQPLGFVR